THAHELSCGICVNFVRWLRAMAADPAAAGERIRAEFGGRSRDEVVSGGFVRDTYEAALWCFATTSCYADCVRSAVNLGSDTDTTACVAGALAGVAYGFDGIPAAWVETLRGKDVLEACLF
ncbi:MAG: ADP-ribosylglycohydrolase family protein, partial [Coriobacteriales bacterium]|nr:ADP-ribosylglycohydrolase family protein [Coriobacteriales bacterium]